MQNFSRTSSIRILWFISLFLLNIINDAFTIFIKNFHCKRLIYMNMFSYFRFCQQNLRIISLSTCSEFGLQVYLLNYMNRAFFYLIASLSLEKRNPGMSVCLFDLLFTKLFLNVYPLVLWEDLGLVSESKILDFSVKRYLISKIISFNNILFPDFLYFHLKYETLCNDRYDFYLFIYLIAY